MRDLDLTRIYVTDITLRKQVEHETHLLATTDMLTGIANRHEFTRVLIREMARAARHAIPLALVMYDIDHFKDVNDTHGHDAGDAVLKAITTIVCGAVRTTDLVARWGGDEFMVLMPHCSLTGAKSAARHLRSALAQFEWPLAGRITASFGVTPFRTADDSHAFLKRVDNALYRAKKRGRNRVEGSIHDDVRKALVA